MGVDNSFDMRFIAINWMLQVTNYEALDERTYSMPPETEFQKYIRSTQYGRMFVHT